MGMTTNRDGLKAAILSCLSDRALSISEIEAQTGEKRPALLAALRELRAEGSVALVGAKRGAKYACGVKPAV